MVYWRWSLEANSPFISSMWSSSLGVGGNGVGGTRCVSSGLFAPPWTTTELGAPCLTRNWDTRATLPTEADIAQALDVQCAGSSQYACMQQAVEGMHNYVHGAIGGTMAYVKKKILQF
jgi:hypothetical protein